MKSLKSEIGTVAGTELIATHPELHHYTTFSGLKGITESNTLWATHYRDLNDTQEVICLADYLRCALVKPFVEIIRRSKRNSLRVQRAVHSVGGLHKAAVSVASDLVKALYELSFHGDDQFAEPFIASFCSHSTDQLYEHENGLLSQWRGYGKGGGFCMVFDTGALADLLQKEFQSYFYAHTNFDNVHYAVPGVDIESLFPYRCREV